MSLLFRQVVISAFIAVAIGTTAGPAKAACPKETSAAVEAARAALAKSEGVAEATACLIEAVDALDQKLNDLIAGKIVFEAPVKARGGFINQGDEPSTEEGR